MEILLLVFLAVVYFGLAYTIAWICKTVYCGIRDHIKLNMKEREEEQERRAKQWRDQENAPE